ncbi:MAG TPA: lipopolysaccharide assembly protein LapA domain-containing protein [Bacteroidales bacterium]|nr:lipopolysaccharide assembly protein LapA domain-containing protein [Bacteroidales bacterium]
MQRSLIIGLLSALILVIFALRNDTVVALYFLWGDPAKGSLSLILLITIIIGVILGVIFSYPSILKQKKKLSENKKEVEKLNTILADYKKEYGLNKKAREKEEEENNQDVSPETKL